MADGRRSRRSRTAAALSLALAGIGLLMLGAPAAHAMTRAQANAAALDATGSEPGSVLATKVTCASPRGAHVHYHLRS